MYFFECWEDRTSLFFKNIKNDGRLLHARACVYEYVSVYVCVGTSINSVINKRINYLKKLSYYTRWQISEGINIK